MENGSLNSAEEQLQQLVGIDQIIAQLDNFRETYKGFFGHYDNIGFIPQLAFLGNPGTGKTTVARIFAKVLLEDGILSKGHIIETSPSELISQYVGQTSVKSRAVYDSAKGGVLFIDEAYGLGLEGFGAEALETLIEFMTETENRDTIVILAGYTGPMRTLFNSNLGLRRRFTEVYFKDYSCDELTEIFRRKLVLKHYIFEEQILDCARTYFESMTQDSQFGNAREVDKLISTILAQQMNRLHEVTTPTEDQNNTILLQDFLIFNPKVEKNEIKADDLLSSGDTEFNEPTDEPPTQEETHKDIDQDEYNKILSVESNLSGQIDGLKESISDINEKMENIQFNVAMLVQKQASSADMAVLQRENEAFRSDSNMKLMRRYGIDAMIKTYQGICDRLFRLKHSQTENEKSDTEINTLYWVLKRIERQFKTLGIKLKTSQPGTTIDESVMVVYGSDGEDVEDSEAIIETDDVNLKDTVKESVCPAFVWTIPSLIGDAKDWYMEVEKVCIYK